MNTDVAMKLIQEFEQYGYSLSFIARNIGISHQTLYLLTQGKKHRLTQKTAQRLVSFYGVFLIAKQRNVA